MAKKFRIVCSYTPREWVLIEAGVRLLGKKSTINYLISEIKNLETLSGRLQDITDKSFMKPQKRQFYPPAESEEILTELSKKLKLPPSTIVARLLLNPLLKYELVAK